MLGSLGRCNFLNSTRESETRKRSLARWYELVQTQIECWGKGGCARGEARGVIIVEGRIARRRQAQSPSFSNTTVTLLLSTDVCPLASSSVCLIPSSTMYKLAQLIKLLLGKQKRLSLSLRSHERKLGKVVCVCNTSAVVAETKGQQGLTGQLAYLLSDFQARDRPASQQTRKMAPEKDSRSSPLTYTDTQIHTHRHIQTFTNTCVCKHAQVCAPIHIR